MIGFTRLLSNRAIHQKRNLCEKQPARISRLRTGCADDCDGRRFKERRRLISSLTLNMNRVRQAAITREIIEIVSGASALYERWPDRVWKPRTFRLSSYA